MDCVTLGEQYTQALQYQMTANAVLGAAQANLQIAQDAANGAQQIADTAALMVTNLIEQGRVLGCDWATGGGVP